MNNDHIARWGVVLVICATLIALTTQGSLIHNISCFFLGYSLGAVCIRGGKNLIQKFKNRYGGKYSRNV